MGGGKAAVAPQGRTAGRRFEVLTPLQNPDQRLVIYAAADTASQAALDTIIREIADRVPTLRALWSAATATAIRLRMAMSSTLHGAGEGLGRRRSTAR
jgi:hypothetical protein